MNELTDEELLNVARNKNESKKQYKARREILRVAMRTYLQRGINSVKRPYIDYVRLTAIIAQDHD